MSSMSYYATTPINNSGALPTQFWGILFDEHWCPTEMFARLADGVFFFLDKNVGMQRDSGLIEPDKLIAWSLAKGTLPAQVPNVSRLQSMYDATHIPYLLISVNGVLMPVLNRQGWLQSAVSEFRADPDRALQDWNRSIASFALCDPMTNLPFPLPIPRTAIPFYAHQPTALNLALWQQAQIQLSSTPIDGNQQVSGAQRSLAKQRQVAVIKGATRVGLMMMGIPPAIVPGLNK